MPSARRGAVTGEGHFGGGTRWTRLHRQELLRAAFALFDRNGDGLLSPEELKAIMCQNVPGGRQHTEAQVDIIVRQFDKDGDNKLSMEELTEAWAQLNIAPIIAAQQFGQQFEQTTPMLVMPLGVFKAQGRIMKSIKVWRDEALATGSLVVHEKDSSKIVIFISHTWWDRAFKDATNDPNNPYDKGAPDLQTGENKNLKWRVICAGVQRLLEQEGLKEEEVSLWIDWQSIYQDDEVEKRKGVDSLIRYATLCQYMLVPTEEAQLVGAAAHFPEKIPDYGGRGWCRIEYFVFSLLAEMQGRKVQLYAIQLDGALKRYPTIAVKSEAFMPSGGDFSNPSDKALVKGLEDKMIAAYGTALVQLKCKEARGKPVSLDHKMLRPQHVVPLFAALEQVTWDQVRYQVAELYLNYNQLGVAGGELVAAALKTNTTLTTLSLAGNKLGPEVGMALAEALKSNTALDTLGLNDNQVGPEGGIALVKALKRNNTLRRLNKNELGPEVGMALAEALKSNTTLEGLQLNGNQVGLEGGMALAEAFKSNNTLRRLDKNELGPEVGMALADALKSNTTLELIDNKLGPEASMALVEALKSNTLLGVAEVVVLQTELLEGRVALELRLKKLRLQNNDLGDDAKRALKAAAGSSLELELTSHPLVTREQVGK